MTRPLLIANWKNHPSSLDEAKSLLKHWSRNAKLYKKLSFFIAPPLPYLETVALRARSFAQPASQDISALSQGTHTSQVTPDILKSFGVRLAIIGHSERRALGETDEIVSQKIKIALRAGITPLLCVGELSRDQDGEHFEFLREQLKSSLAGLSRKADSARLAIAYEPVWAIGKSAKDALGPDELSQTIIFIKKILTDMFGRALAERIPILYGGSVEVSNVENLFKGTGIRGFLVGHASLNAKSLGIIAQLLLKK